MPNEASNKLCFQVEVSKLRFMTTTYSFVNLTCNYLFSLVNNIHVFFYETNLNSDLDSSLSFNARLFLNYLINDTNALVLKSCNSTCAVGNPDY